MPQLDSSIPAVDFPIFNELPEELRMYIWISALPGPRIIYVQRYPKSGEDPDVLWRQDREESSPPEPTCFISTSPKSSIISLLRACKESYTVVTKHYSLILPSPSTWFSFSTDFLYLDWGFGPVGNTIIYDPGDFINSSISDIMRTVYDPPEISMEIARKVRNLVLYVPYIHRSVEQWLVRDVLRVFSGVKVMVIADRLHHMDDAGEELLWLRGKLGDESRWLSELHTKEKIEGQGGPKHEPQTEKQYRLWLGRLLLWKDGCQYGLSPDVDQQIFETNWVAHYKLTDGREMPTIFKKSITTATVKKKLLEICGSEDNFWKLEGLDWGFVKGDHRYSGDLDLSQQISFLELALGRVLIEYKVDCNGSTELSEDVEDIELYLAKLDALRFEREIMEIVISEAEEMV